MLGNIALLTAALLFICYFGYFIVIQLSMWVSDILLADVPAKYEEQQRYAETCNEEDEILILKELQKEDSSIILPD